MTATPETLAASRQFRETGHATNAVTWIAELTTDKAASGIKPLPTVDPEQVATDKATAEAEVAKLEAELAVESDEQIKLEKESALAGEQAKIAKAEYLLRIEKGQLTPDDEKRIAAEQAGHEAEMADKRQALIKRGLIVDKADAANAEKLAKQAAELAKLNAILGTDIKVADVVAVAEQTK